MQLGCGVFKVVLLCNLARLGTCQSTFGLLQLRASADTGEISFPNFSEDIFVRCNIFDGELIKAALLEDFKISLYCPQCDIVGRIVDVVECGVDSRCGLFDLVGSVISIEQVLCERQFERGAVVVD